MAKLSHTLEYVAARTGVGLVSQLSPKQADSFGAWLGRTVWRLAGSRRKIAADNLRMALGDKLSEDEIEGIVKRVFENIGRTLVEFSRFGQLTRERMDEIIVGDGQEYIRKAHEEGRGAVFVTAHFGNWELVGGWSATNAMEVDFLTGTQHNEKINEMFNDFRRSFGVNLLPLRSSLRGAFRSLKANHMTAMAADQHDGAQGMIIDFFGRKASTAKGPAIFALKANCPILPFVMRRERYDRHVVMAGDPVYPPNTGDPDEDMRQMTRGYLRFFEEAITQYPDQWMWTHRRWKI